MQNFVCTLPAAIVLTVLILVSTIGRLTRVFCTRIFIPLLFSGGSRAKRGRFSERRRTTRGEKEERTGGRLRPRIPSCLSYPRLLDTRRGPFFIGGKKGPRGPPERAPKGPQGPAGAPQAPAEPCGRRGPLGGLRRSPEKAPRGPRGGVRRGPGGPPRGVRGVDPARGARTPILIVKYY